MSYVPRTRLSEQHRTSIRSPPPPSSNSRQYTQSQNHSSSQRIHLFPQDPESFDPRYNGEGWDPNPPIPPELLSFLQQQAQHGSGGDEQAQQQAPALDVYGRFSFCFLRDNC